MEDITQYLATFAQNLPGIQSAILIFAGMVGVFSVGFGLIGQYKNGRRGEGVLSSTVASICVGSFLLSLPTVVGIFSTTLFDTAADPRLIDSYAQTSGDNVRVAIQALVAVINVIGWFAAARGLWRWKIGPSSNQPGWFGSGLTFVIAGTIATNLYVFADMLAVSVGAMPVGTTYFKFN